MGRDTGKIDRIAISPCPNDTFAFYSLIHDRRYEFDFLDIEELNRALPGRMVSIHDPLEEAPVVSLADQLWWLLSSKALLRDASALLPFDEEARALADVTYALPRLVVRTPSPGARVHLIAVQPASGMAGAREMLGGPDLQLPRRQDLDLLTRVHRRVPCVGAETHRLPIREHAVINL